MPQKSLRLESTHERFDSDESLGPKWKASPFEKERLVWSRGGRTRTYSALRATDLKSVVSTVPPRPRNGKRLCRLGWQGRFLHEHFAIETQAAVGAVHRGTIF